MSTRELRRVEVLAQVKSKTLKVVDAARLVGVSYRQVQRKWVPPNTHPWREAARRGVQRRARELEVIAARASSARPSASL